MAELKRVAAVADCPAGHQLELVVGGRIIALFNCDGQFYALDGVCPHQGGPLAKGQLHGCILTCPWHGWQFDIRTGQNQLSQNVVQPIYRCKTEGSDIYLEMGSE
jgi:nitrite reductase/ring-hydroxylating ferredoxin subunit